jgi:hypothetical protein
MSKHGGNVQRCAAFKINKVRRMSVKVKKKLDKKWSACTSCSVERTRTLIVNLRERIEHKLFRI